MNDRYRNQTRLVRAYRWLRWKPLYAGIAGLHILLWVLRGAKPLVWMDFEGERNSLGQAPVNILRETRRSTLAHIWQRNMSMASFYMQDYVTADEWLNRLK